MRQRGYKATYPQQMEAVSRFWVWVSVGGIRLELVGWGKDGVGDEGEATMMKYSQCKVSNDGECLYM